MDTNLLSHIMLWTVGGMSIVGLVLVVGAFFSLGRSAYRED